MRRLFCFLYLLLLLFIGCASPTELDVGVADDAVVYGTDDRLDAFEHSNASLVAIAEQSVAAIVPYALLVSEVGGGFSIDAAVQTLGAAQTLCEGEPFASQPTASKCSAVLVDTDLLITAGHCYASIEQNPFDCESDRYVFDYRMIDATTLATIDADDVYSCSRLEARVMANNIDYAVIRLDRPVVGRTPVSTFAGASAVAQGVDLALVGFGAGLPVKIQSQAKVSDPRICARDALVANVDAFGGDSGAGVFTLNGKLVGFLTSGEQDYETDGSCNQVRKLNDIDANERILYAQTLGSFVCTSLLSASFCAGYRCNASRCIPTDWSCSDSDFSDGAVCNLSCGGFDPDCLDESLPRSSLDDSCALTVEPPSAHLLKGGCSLSPAVSSLTQKAPLPIALAVSVVGLLCFRRWP